MAVGCVTDAHVAGKATIKCGHQCAGLHSFQGHGNPPSRLSKKKKLADPMGFRLFLPDVRLTRSCCVTCSRQALEARHGKSHRRRYKYK